MIRLALDAAEIIEENIEKGNVVKGLALMELGNRLEPAPLCQMWLLYG